MFQVHFVQQLLEYIDSENNSLYKAVNEWYTISSSGMQWTDTIVDNMHQFLAVCNADGSDENT